MARVLKTMGSMSGLVAPTIAMLPPSPPEKLGCDVLTRGQQHKQEEEGFVAEGSGKNKNFNFTEYLNNSDMEADGEQLDEE